MCFHTSFGRKTVAQINSFDQILQEKKKTSSEEIKDTDMRFVGVFVCVRGIFLILVAVTDSSLHSL